MTAYEYLCGVQRFLPASRDAKHLGRPVSKGEIKRWLQNKSVLINGRRPDWNEAVEYPIYELIFFPNSPKNRTTYIQDWAVDRDEDILLEARLDLCYTETV